MSAIPSIAQVIVNCVDLDVSLAYYRDVMGLVPVGEVREVAPGETFMRLTQASTNYVALGEAGFTTLTRFVRSVPSRAIDYQSGEEAVALVEQLWERLA